MDAQRILDLVQPGESVLDLGCGDGQLLCAHHARQPARIQGIEINLDSLRATATKGIPVQQHDLNGGKLEFPDDSFDVAILSATLQSVANIESLFEELRDMYAHQGRSPKAHGEYRFDWYNTPNRRFPSILDVQDLIVAKGARVDEALYLDTQHNRLVSEDEDFNYLADTAILVMSRR